MPSSTPAPSNSATARHQLVGHSPAGQLVAQRGLFRGPSPLCPDDLYAQIRSGAAVRERQRLVLRPHSTVSLDTYFGRFPASYWQRWSVVDEVTVELVVTGSGQLRVIASDAEGETRPVAGRTVDGAVGTVVQISVRLDRFLDGGFLWLDLATEDADLTVEQLRWTVAPPAQLRPTAVVICTFNRADDCLRTLESLAGDKETLDVLDAVYVVDQGTDTVESRPGFPDVDKALDGRLRYLRQPNLGGAGGFGRGMYEVAEVSHAAHANVLLMDDDVLCEPEIAIRLTAFANRTPIPTIVGGQMLRLLHPTHLLAGAEYANFHTFMPGRVVEHGLDDVDLLAERLDDEGLPTGKPNRGDRRVDADYNAWWSCLIPSELIAELGYPLPLFFKWDDIEYGYRARAKGYPTVTLPGAGLWHADFDWKDADSPGEYFVIRNGLITTALHSDVPPKHTARVLAGRVVRMILSMQYGMAATLLKAIEDYLEGPAILTDGGVRALRGVKEERDRYPDTVMHSTADLARLHPGVIPTVAARPAPSMERLVLLKRLVYAALGRVAHEIGAVAYRESPWWHVSQFNTVVVTDGSQESVRIRSRDRRIMTMLARRLGRDVRRLVAEGDRIREQYRAAVPELTGKDNWKRLWGL